MPANGCPACNVLPRFDDGYEHPELSQIDERHGTRPHSPLDLGTRSPFPGSPSRGLRSALLPHGLFLSHFFQTQRTIAVIKALGAVAPAIVSREVYYAGAKHLIPILQLLIPGIDLVRLPLSYLVHITQAPL
jgi:hypothetical protein